MNTRSFALIFITILIALSSCGCRLLNYTKKTTTQAQTRPLSKEQLMIKETADNLRENIPLEVVQKTTLDGRDDPFSLLPEEKVKEQVSTNPPTKQHLLLNPSTKIRLKGIILTDKPSALIEMEGSYHRVKVGELIKGDLVVAINEDSLVIQRAGTLLTILMGE